MVTFDADTLRRLERIKNRGTLYEVVVTDGERTVLVVYCGKSQPRFFSALRANDNERAKALVALTGEENFQAGSWKAGEVMKLGKWVVKFSGRTQRDAIIDNKGYPYLTDAVQIDK